MGIRTGKRTKQKKLITRVPGLICLAVVLAAACTGGMRVRAALENEKSTETRSVHMQDGQIPQATLAIGSHLIHINGMTDELYAAALESANEFNQHQMYYKSELANGAWFEISEAVSIEDISTSGNPVNKSIIEALEFTHMTGANGMTTDLRNGQFVSVFDMNNPYDLNKLEELVNKGVYIQINANSFLSHPKKKQLVSLIDEGLIHFIGTDCHRMDWRPVNLRAACRHLADHIDEEDYCRIFFENPQKLLKNEII